MSFLVFISGVSVGYLGTHICFCICTLDRTLGFFIGCTPVVTMSNVGSYIYIPVVGRLIVI